MKLSAKELAEVLHGTVDGDPQACATAFAKIEHGKPGQLCFFANPKYEHYVYTSKASILLVNKDFQPSAPVTPTLVRVESAYTALAELLDYVNAQKKSYKRHRGRCRIAWSAKLGKKVWVGDFVTIGKKAVVGDFTKIYDNVTIGQNVRIGEKCIIYPGVHIFPDTVIGDRTILHAGCIIGDDGFGNAPQSDGTWKKIEHVGNVIIGNDVEIGSNTCVDKAPMESTIIEDGVRIDNLCQIAHNVRVGANTAILVVSSFTMRHNMRFVNGQPQGRSNPVNNLRHDFNLLCSRWKAAEAGRTATIAAAKSDANGAGIAPPSVAFSLRQIISSHIDAAISRDIDVIILKYSGMIASRPVQVDFRLPAFSFRLAPDSHSRGRPYICV